MCGFRNKLHENDEVTRNTSRLVWKGYAHEEGIDHRETSIPIKTLEGVRTILSYSAYKDFKFYQIDVKSTFLKGIHEEEVYIEQLECFVDPNNKDVVFIFHKSLYRLKHAPKAWYERLHNYLVKIGFEKIDHNNNLYMKIQKGKGILISKICRWYYIWCSRCIISDIF